MSDYLPGLEGVPATKSHISFIDGERGIWHLANAGAISWAGLARQAALDPDDGIVL
mgnify:CR=1 FL=1